MKNQKNKPNYGNHNSPFEHQTGKQGMARNNISSQQQDQSYGYNSGNKRVQMQDPQYTQDRIGGCPQYPVDNGPVQMRNGSRRQPGMTNYYACQVVRAVFIVIFLIECYYCYMWLIQPVMPLITDVIEHNGVPSVGFSMPSDITHPLNGISVAGISGNNMLSLWSETLIRAGIFGIIFPATIKIRGFVLRVFS